MKANATQNGALRRGNNANTAQGNSDFSASQSDSEVDDTPSPAFEKRPLSSVEATASVSTWQKICQVFKKVCEILIFLATPCAIIASMAIGCALLFLLQDLILKFAFWCQMHALKVTFLLIGEAATIIALVSSAYKLNKLANEHQDLSHQQLTGPKIIQLETKEVQTKDSYIANKKIAV